ncbi:MAG: radical SAM protein [Lachnospiraceae bacterium]|nr:radical SAM protein [Lachnospiraceae bacterium]
MYSRVYIEITNICNMHCSFCHGHGRVHRRMDRDEFAYILDQLEGQTDYIYYHLMGEPLTHPDLPLFLQMAVQRGFRSVITTNGKLLAKRGDEIIASGVHKVSISVHSFEQDDDEAYKRYLSEVADFADKASKAGIIVVLRFWNRDHDDGRNDRAVTFLRRRFTGEWAENTRGIRIRNKLHLEWGDRFAWPDVDAPVQGSEVFCYGLRDHFGILCDGSVVPCCMDSDGVITLGNIFSEDISDILASPRAREMVQGFERRTASEELCRRCGYAQRFV